MAYNSRGGNVMAGLLDTIARRLLGSNSIKSTTASRATTKTASSESVKVKPVAASTANDWVKNSTISEPVVVKPVSTEQPVVDNTVPESEITAIDRTIKRERTKKDVEREDYLLTQIDEFREKAQQLQNLLLSKENKVMELQNIVDEREGKAKELEYILNERQRKADGITAEVSKQIDALIEKVTAKMDEIGVSIEKDVTEGQKITAEQMEELKETLASVNAQLETIKGELSEKVHTENVKCYRNISDLFKSLDEKVDSIQEVEQNVEKKVGSIRKCTITVIVLSIINMLGLTAVILMELGVFNMFLK